MSTTPLLDKLPAEVRLIIYKHLSRSSEVAIYSKKCDANVSDRGTAGVNFLQTCKTINTEATSVFLREARFVIKNVFPDYTSINFSPNLLKIANLTIPVLTTNELSQVRDFFVSHDSKLQNLTILAHGSLGTLLWSCFTSLDFATNLTQIINFGKESLDLASKIVNKVGYPPYSPARIGVFKIKGSGSQGEPSKRLTIFGPLRGDVEQMFDMMIRTQFDHSWLLAGEVEVNMTNDWPYKVIKVGVEKLDGASRPRLKW